MSRADTAIVALRVVGAVFRPAFWRKVRANRQAAKAGKPKPYTVAELLGEAVGAGADVADTIRDHRRGK